MKAVIVYDALWGSTLTIARASAKGIGSEARAVSASEASPAADADADLAGTGAAVIAFGLPLDQARKGLASNPCQAPSRPYVSNALIRSWIDRFPAWRGRSAAFETRVRFAPGGSTSNILRGLERTGC
jgi:hypothetical protein